ncbi:hypothetical protein NDU88_003113 [Pleurodeles waltl]|uniref:Reverse transcriptase RNase H-like domain-containing protein n=1 Tax=Pleurodeles waltl TaxID=8319 RepID=A0AAV7PAC6_PLEWA|nr:hypothetical protein NDU88_003113 [Pleurodeles waltl]
MRAGCGPRGLVLVATTGGPWLRDGGPSTCDSALSSLRETAAARSMFGILHVILGQVASDGKLLLITDHRNLAQFLKRRMAEGRGREKVDTLSRYGCD